jgi:ATP-dependent protease HslVU (ClpYQ) ATPase subunit
MVLTGEIIDEAFENFYATFQNLAEKYAFFFRLKYAYLYTNIDDHVNKITHEKALFLFLLDQLENNVTTFTSLDHILLKLCIFSTASLIGDDEIEYSIEMAKNIIVEASISLLGVLPSHVGDMINNFHIVDPSSYFNQHKLNKSKAEVLKNKSGKMFIKTESISSQAWKSIVLEGLVQLQTIIKLIDSSKSHSEHQISSQDSKRGDDLLLLYCHI